MSDLSTITIYLFHDQIVSTLIFTVFILVIVFLFIMFRIIKRLVIVFMFRMIKREFRTTVAVGLIIIFLITSGVLYFILPYDPYFILPYDPFNYFVPEEYKYALSVSLTIIAIIEMSIVWGLFAKSGLFITTTVVRSIFMVILLFLSLMVLIGTSRIFLNPSKFTLTLWGMLATFVVYNIVWGIFLHYAAKEFGWWLTKIFTDNWVKAMDYMYLGLSSVGMLRLLTAVLDTQGNTDIVSDTQELKQITAVSVLVIGLGVTLRVTKTSIEIFEWHKRSPSTAPSKVG